MDKLRDLTYSTQPHNIRDDYFSAPLRVNLVEMLEGHTLVKESFNLEVRVPKIEIITTSKEVNRENRTQELVKTTMTHHLTGSQMCDLLTNYSLVEWVQFA